MSGRQRLFDDLAGVAGGAISALAGLREEAEAVVRARVEAAIRRFDLVRRDELDAALALAANARAGQEAAEARLAGGAGGAGGGAGGVGGGGIPHCNIRLYMNFASLVIDPLRRGFADR